MKRYTPTLFVFLVLVGGASFGASSKQATEQLVTAVSQSNLAQVQTLLKQKNANVNTTVHNAPLIFLVIENENDGILKAFLSAGVDLKAKDAHGNDALAIACADGEVAAVKAILSTGQPVNRVNGIGQTPLIMALLTPFQAHNRAAIVALLVSHNADVNMPDHDGFTPLMYASLNGLTVSGKYLLDHHANIQAHSPSGMTPLMCAAKFAFTETVKLLVSRGANLWAKDHAGKTALMLAEKNQMGSSHQAVIAYLKKKMAVKVKT